MKPASRVSAVSDGSPSRSSSFSLVSAACRRASLASSRTGNASAESAPDLTPSGLSALRGERRGDLAYECDRRAQQDRVGALEPFERDLLLLGVVPGEQARPRDAGEDAAVGGW